MSLSTGKSVRESTVFIPLLEELIDMVDIAERLFGVIDVPFIFKVSTSKFLIYAVDVVPLNVAQE